MKKHMFVDQMVKNPPFYEELDVEQIKRICNEALNEPNRLGASTILSSFLTNISLPGIRKKAFYLQMNLNME